MTTILAYLGASIAEIVGCFSFWAWIKLEKTPLWIVPGVVSLCLFAYLLTFVESDYAGRAYAAYGAIYILSSIAWMYFVEGSSPDRFDLLGVVVCLIGAAIIMLPSRG
jgi:small multidrug resistance family-3 protein